MKNITYLYSELQNTTQQLLHTSINLYFESLEELKLIHHLFSPEIISIKHELLNNIITFQHSAFLDVYEIQQSDFTSIILSTNNLLQHFTISQGNFAMKIYNKLYLAGSILLQVENKLFSISN